MSNVSEYTVTELKKLAKSKGFTGYSKLRKSELIKLVRKRSHIRSRRSPRNKGDSKKQIAFCFLLYETIQHLDIWENFFDQDHDGTATIYTHLKTVTNKTPGWIEKSKVRTVNTNWCGEGLIYAFTQMLKKALGNSSNKYFALISGSDIPLYTYPETYKKITSSSKSRITYERHDGNVFEDRNDIYNGHQWVILNRETAMDYIKLVDPKNRKAKAFIQKFRNIYKENGVSVGRKKAIKSQDSTWIGGCPDEIYPINWLIYLYGRKNISKHVSNQMTTYTKWDFEKDPDHPEVFNIRTVKSARKEICDHGHIFARKFTEDAADYIAMNCGKGYSSTKKNHYNPIVRKQLVGRIGNQMFQYASALGIAHAKKGDVCIITDDDLIVEDELRSTKDDLINVCKGPFNICGRPDYPFTVVEESAYAKYNMKHFMVPGNIEIETDMDTGFLQSYKYFEHIKDLIKKKFQFKGDVSRRVIRYMKKMKSNDYKVIGLHARRGDHLALGYMKFPPPKYFDKARDYFRKKYGASRVRFIVATNDRSWAKENFESDDTEIISHSKSASEDLAILGACDGVIMSLGTFGWWGGYLCGGPVVYYRNEFNMSHEVNKGNVRKSDYYPDYWIGLK
jgi:galactoside 2-L-fucosyltransferase 1/2